jgi:type VI secretion system secreted protein Hcp
MSQISVYLKLTAGDTEVKGDSSVQEMAGVDTSEMIECIAFQSGVSVGYDGRAARPTGDRAYEPVTITKWVDRASPVLAQALTETRQCTGEFQFFRPSSDGTGMEQYFKVKIENARIGRVKLDFQEGESQSLVREQVEFVFSRITWTHGPGGTEHTDDWTRRPGS